MLSTIHYGLTSASLLVETAKQFESVPDYLVRKGKEELGEQGDGAGRERQRHADHPAG
jgi:hypothetical protein